MINPEIIERKGTYVDNDDCMSVKEESKVYIKRSNHVTIKYNTPENEEKILAVRNDAAAQLEHEIDHLNGVLNIDYGENSPPIQSAPPSTGHAIFPFTHGPREHIPGDRSNPAQP